MALQTPQTKSRGEERNIRFRPSLSFETPFDPKKPLHSQATPETVMTTPSTPLSESMSYREISEDGYLGEHDDYHSTRLFRDDADGKRSPSCRKQRRSLTVVKRSSKLGHRKGKAMEYDITPATSSSTDASDDSSPDRIAIRTRSKKVIAEELNNKGRRALPKVLVVALAVGLVASFRWIIRTDRSMKDEYLLQYERSIKSHHHHHKGPMTAGLRGKLVLTSGRTSMDAPVVSMIHHSTQGDMNRMSSAIFSKNPLKFHNPKPIEKLRKSDTFESQDRLLYQWKRGKKNESKRRIVFFSKKPFQASQRTLKLYPSDFTDNTQYYGLFDSEDERLSHMERRLPLDDGDCVPMKEWQTTYHPSCNGMHELGMEHMGENETADFTLFGVKGYWRNAWRVNSYGGSNGMDTIVLKTLKFQHNFEDAHFEHDRVDAVAMERLTASPHVINIFGFCGHSVLTEFADGPRVGELADKKKSTPLARLRIARDIANGLADVHGIDGDELTTFVHLDINPANVVSIGGTLKLNDFNIGILRRWNTTSNTYCGFPAQFPNPQWRSPEEARNEQHLTEKVDVFSMGHIFFRLICGHEPWNKLEEGGKPSKEAITNKVLKGVLPRIPEEILTTNDPEVIAIRDAMLACYTFEPNHRPSARSIAGRLQETLDLLEQKDDSKEY